MEKYQEKYTNNLVSKSMWTKVTSLHLDGAHVACFPTVCLNDNMTACL